MGKNILILTHQYSCDTKPNGRWTKVVSYFAHEWAKDNRVLVIINSSKFPKQYYSFGSVLRWVAKRNSKDPALITDQSWREPFDFDDDGIRVYNRPMLKFWPHAMYSDFQLKKQAREIISILEENNFKPDIIDGHWLNPQLDLLLLLREYYKAKTALVLHMEAITARYYTKSIERKLNRIDKVGCRSHHGAATLNENLRLKEKPFVCSSGIPDKYVETAVEEKTVFGSSQVHVVTVSRLMDWKCLDAAIKGIDDAFKGTDYRYMIIGDGPEQPKLQTLIDERRITGQVELAGRLPREVVLENLKGADLFVLISKHETFGLVYLEAMLQGCIAIASKNGGVDGIIVDGENGFLCNEGDEQDLERTIKKILCLSNEEKQAVSLRARQTALNYTDSKVSKRYLDIISQ